MSCCGLCNRVFRDNYNLKRHLSQSKPCVKDNDQVPNPSCEQNQSFVEQNRPLSEQKQLSKKCKYCMISFYNKPTMKRHLLTCRQKNDPIRLMEIENKIQVEVPDIKTECRFCKKDYNNTSNLNKHLFGCTEREEYRKMLIIEDSKRTEIIQQTIINNNHIGDNIVNNIVNVNILGHENMDHIELERIVDLFRSVSKEFGYSRICLTAGSLINSFDNYIRETPENQNIIIPDPKSIYGNIKTELGWEKVSADQCLNKAFKKSANELYNRKEALNTHNNKMFVSEANRSVFKEVKSFADNGLINATITDDIRQIKTSYKVSKLKDRVVDF